MKKIPKIPKDVIILIIILLLFSFILFFAERENKETQKCLPEFKFIDNSSLTIFQNHFNLTEGQEIKCNIRSVSISPESIGEIYKIECQDLKYYCKVVNITYEVCDTNPTFHEILYLGNCYK